MISVYCDMGELVSAVLDGEATDLERATARRHLRSCGACRDFRAFAEATRAKEREGLVPRPHVLRGAETRRGLSGERLAREVRRGRRGSGVRHMTLTVLAALAFGVAVGVGGAGVAGELGLSEAVQPEYRPGIGPSRPMSPNFIRLFETPPQNRELPVQPAGSAEWDDRFVEYVSLEDYPPNPRPAHLAMTP